MPTTTRPRKYDKLRAVQRDWNDADMPTEDVAERAGLKPSSLRGLATRMRQRGWHMRDRTEDWRMPAPRRADEREAGGAGT